MNRQARFDDLTRGSAKSFEFIDQRDEIVAQSPDDTEAAFGALDEALARGLWVAGYVSYDAAPAFDHSLQVPGDVVGIDSGPMPVLWFGVFGDKVAAEPFVPRSAHPAPYHVSGWTPGMSREEHAKSVAAVHDAIGAGDTYQVNLTFPLRAAFSGSADEFYRDLVLAQRGGFGAYLDAGRYKVVSASPERFFSMREGRIALRPMKGTIRRGRWPEEDAAMARTLLVSEKDRAENLMIVDLLRNDLGRIAQFGSVEVEALLATERYETLWQLTSDIVGQVGPEVGLLDVFRALFPSGSVTGAPKISTMGIIADLEQSARGVYCGAIGYAGPRVDGYETAEFSVAIRTVTIDADEGLASYGVGGAITWDSSSEGEFEEARLKAQLLVERRPEFGLLETMRWDPWHGYWWLDAHLERIAGSAGYFGYGCDRGAIVRSLGDAVAQARTPRRVRLILSRDGSIVAESSELAEPLAASFDAGLLVRVAIAEEPVSAQNVFLFHKTTNRSPYTRRKKPYPSADDVILSNEDGYITESSAANVVVWREDQWVTPPLEHGLLAGVFRGELLANGLVVEGAIKRDELLSAPRVGLVNSVRGWQQARLLG